MTKNPLLNALAASMYITGVALFVTFVPLEHSIPMPLAPIAFLSLFVFSAATMGYLFLYQPAQLVLDGHKKEGVTLFIQTLLCFALVSIVIVGCGAILYK